MSKSKMLPSLSKTEIMQLVKLFCIDVKYKNLYCSIVESTSGCRNNYEINTFIGYSYSDLI